MSNIKKWYDVVESIQTDEPIVAINKDDNKNILLLVPSLSGEKGNYEIIGFNWLFFPTGRYNSCCNFETAKDAMDAYSNSYVFKNINLIEIIDQIK